MNRAIQLMPLVEHEQVRQRAQLGGIGPVAGCCEFNWVVARLPGIRPESGYRRDSQSIAVMFPSRAVSAR